MTSTGRGYRKGSRGGVLGWLAGRRRQRVIELLSHSYVDEAGDAARLQALLAQIPYEHLRSELQPVLATEQRHVELLRAAIEHRGGAVPESLAVIEGSWQDLMAAVVQETDDAFRYLELARASDDLELAQLLERLYAEDRTNQQVILQVLAKMQRA
ncbi:MAG: ferritin-like domain-containing protein [Deinococcus sp.]|nr:ferritin-like domain-containing protein [Deinococcus sp.]